MQTEVQASERDGESEEDPEAKIAPGDVPDRVVDDSEGVHGNEVVAPEDQELADIDQKNVEADESSDGEGGPVAGCHQPELEGSFDQGNREHADRGGGLCPRAREGGLQQEQQQGEGS